MQFQVHTADGDKILRCGKSYGGEYTPGSSMPANRRITFKDKKIAETSSLPSSPVGTSTVGMDSEEGQQMSRELLEALLLLLLVTHSRSGVGSTLGAHLCMAKTLRYLF